MNPEITFCFYLVIGIGVAVALWLRRDFSAGAADLFQILSAPFFWPIFLPVLLTRRPEPFNVAISSFAGVTDSMNAAISQVERELDTALQSLDGWAENVLADEQHRIAELKRAWRQQAIHIREIDRLLAQTLIEPASLGLRSFTDAQADDAATPAKTSAIEARPDQTTTNVLNEAEHDSRSAEHEKTRAENIARLKQLRRSMLDDLLATIAWVRELVTMIHLAKYTGAPASRAQELVKQIASAVKGLSEINRTTVNPV